MIFAYDLGGLIDAQFWLIADAAVLTLAATA
jgi:hypothetical protein